VSQPLVSILIPAYNHAQYVGAAVESVLGQTHEHLELIAIDDASQDDTWAVLQSFQDKRLQRCRHAANQGAPATLNEAMALARGEYIAILNSDDIYDPRRIERLLVEIARSGDREAFVFSDVAFIDAAGREIHDHPRARNYQALRSYCEALSPTSWFFAGNPAISTSNFFFSRSLARRVGDFSSLRYTHDWDWAFRAMGYGTLSWVQEGLLAYRVHQTNTLSEDDLWRHIHENSYVQACALLSLQLGEGNDSEPLVRAEEILLALMRNESLHPLSLLCYLAYGLAGVDTKRLLELTVSNGCTSWFLSHVADAASCVKEIFYSLELLKDQVSTVPMQAAMLEERWQAMQHMQQEIVNRDRWIADLNAFLQEKERCIVSQAALIEERWDAIQQMSGEIANRDRQIKIQQAEVAAKQAEIARLNRNFFIRATRYLKRKLSALGLNNEA
jgi:GT2 family glycosyltransferase